MGFRPILNFDDFTRFLLTAILFAVIPVGTSTHTCTRIETAKGHFLRLASRVDQNPARNPCIRLTRTRIQDSWLEGSTVQQRYDLPQNTLSDRKKKPEIINDESVNGHGGQGTGRGKISLLFAIGSDNAAESMPNIMPIAMIAHGTQIDIGTITAMPANAYCRGARDRCIDEVLQSLTTNRRLTASRTHGIVMCDS